MSVALVAPAVAVQAAPDISQRDPKSLTVAEIKALTPQEIEHLKTVPADQLPASIITPAGEVEEVTEPVKDVPSMGPSEQVKCQTYNKFKQLKNQFGWLMFRYGHKFDWCVVLGRVIRGTPDVNVYHEQHWGYKYDGEDHVTQGWVSRPYVYRDRRQAHFSVVYDGLPYGKTVKLSDCVYWTRSGHSCN
jgi:hypothetical protein